MCLLDNEVIEMYEDFAFLEAHPLSLHTKDNKYGREYRFENGYIHVMRDE